MLNDKEHKSKFDPKSDEGMFLRLSHNNRAYKLFNNDQKQLWNVVVDDQGIAFTEIRNDDAETEVPHYVPGDSVSTNDASSKNRLSPAAEDASSSGELYLQYENLTTSVYGYIQESSRQVQKDHSTIDIIGDLEA